MDSNSPAFAFLQKDYELKIRYLTDHYTRMWNRFNFFVGVETALSVALFGWFKEKGGFTSEATFIAMVGAVSSICWYMFGAQDRFLAESYRNQVKFLGEKITNTLSSGETPVLSSEELETYSYVGNTEIKDADVKGNLYQWRINLISTTKLVALFPLMVFLYWSAMIVFMMRLMIFS